MVEARRPSAHVLDEGAACEVPPWRAWAFSSLDDGRPIPWLGWELVWRFERERGSFRLSSTSSPWMECAEALDRCNPMHTVCQSPSQGGSTCPFTRQEANAVGITDFARRKNCVRGPSESSRARGSIADRTERKERGTISSRRSRRACGLGVYSNPLKRWCVALDVFVSRMHSCQVHAFPCRSPRISVEKERDDPSSRYRYLSSFRPRDFLPIEPRSIPNQKETHLGSTRPFVLASCIHPPPRTI